MSSRRLCALYSQVAKYTGLLEYPHQDHHPDQEAQRLPVDGLYGLLLSYGSGHDQQDSARQRRRRTVDEVRSKQNQYGEEYRQGKKHHRGSASTIRIAAFRRAHHSPIYSPVG